MSLFGGSPFDDFFGGFFKDSSGFEEEFFNGRESKNFYSSDAENFIESENKIYFVLDLSNIKDVNISIKDKLLTNEYGEKVTNGKKFLEIISSEGEKINYLIPKSIKIKNFQWTFKNGILEVIFKK